MPPIDYSRPLPTPRPSAGVPRSTYDAGADWTAGIVGAVLGFSLGLLFVVAMACAVPGLCR